MSTSCIGARLPALLLALAFAVSAYLKTRHLLIERDWVLVLPALREPPILIALILSEAMLAAGLLTRIRHTAAWGAAAFAVGASVFLVYSRFVYGPGVQCGCLGSIPLTVWEHMILASAVFALAVLVICTKKTASPAT